MLWRCMNDMTMCPLGDQIIVMYWRLTPSMAMTHKEYDHYNKGETEASESSLFLMKRYSCVTLFLHCLSRVVIAYEFLTGRGEHLLSYTLEFIELCIWRNFFCFSPKCLSTAKLSICIVSIVSIVCIVYVYYVSLFSIHIEICASLWVERNVLAKH
jgi:hypothetical protein